MNIFVVGYHKRADLGRYPEIVYVGMDSDRAQRAVDSIVDERTGFVEVWSEEGRRVRSFCPFYDEVQLDEQKSTYERRIYVVIKKPLYQFDTDSEILYVGFNRERVDSLILDPVNNATFLTYAQVWLNGTRMANRVPTKDIKVSELQELYV